MPQIFCSHSDLFLSTPSARRATKGMIDFSPAQPDFYPRPPRGGRPVDWHLAVPVFCISIHALREEGDGRFSSVMADSSYFYPRPPRGGRPCSKQMVDYAATISIHALREEGDVVANADDGTGHHFYPRPPRGGRRVKLCCCAPEIQFLSTPSARRATLLSPALSAGTSIFLSTPSARRATAKTERKHPAFVSLYTSLHKLQRDVCKPNRKITPLLAQTAGIPVRSVPENHVCCRFALAGHQKISTLSCANSGCSPTCSTLVW